MARGKHVLWHRWPALLLIFLVLVWTAWSMGWLGRRATNYTCDAFRTHSRADTAVGLNGSAEGLHAWWPWSWTGRRAPSDLACVTSTIDGEVYCVRGRDPDRLQATADRLAQVTQHLNRVVAHVRRVAPNDPRVRRLVANYRADAIRESLPTDADTAYIDNKGETVAFCMSRKAKHSRTQLIDLDTLTFVALHELSHIACASVGHGEEFWATFAWILQQARDAGVHMPVDYRVQPTTYCGEVIADNPYFDRPRE